MKKAIAMLVLMLALGSGAAQPDKPPLVKKEAPAAVDRYGDPLPDGAIARLGTMLCENAAP